MGNRVRDIFLSYRRDDSEGEAGRLFDDLVKHFGETRVFMDVAAIEVGRDFRKAIDASVAGCGVLLAIIGQNWLDAKNEAGQRRLDDPSDFVRLETASALKRDIPVIPILVHGARMPRADQLPDDLKDLAYRNGCELTHARWSSDLQLLIGALRAVLGDPKSPAHVVREGVAGEGGAPPAPNQDRDHGETKRIPAPSAPTRSKSRWTILAIVLSTVAAVVVAAYLLIPKPVAVPGQTGKDSSQAPAQQEVPPLVGASLSVAEGRLSRRHLVIGRTTSESKAGVAPNTVLSQSPASGIKVDTGSAVDMVVSAATGAKEPGSVSPDQSQLPKFGGTWEAFEALRDGTSRQITKGRRLVFKQDGAVVTFGLREFTITASGTVTYPMFLAHNGQDQSTPEGADVISTQTWKVAGDILVYEATYKYSAQYQGTRTAGPYIIRYRRVSAE
jgi:TIR domain/PASTA domain